MLTKKKLLVYVGIVLAFVFLLNQSEIIAQGMHADNTIPAYPGGKDALKEFISKNLRYPEEAKKSGISGVVVVNFRINKEGKVENVKVAKGISVECDAEAIRITSLITGWTQGMRQGKPVETMVSMPIEFKGENKLHPEVITGKVTERNTGLAVEGVFVIIKGTNIGSVTAQDGSYRLEVPAESRIIECFGVGYSFKEIPIDFHSTINIELDSEYLIIDFSVAKDK
jgi:protein TonB